ncbi:MAG: hypothetical protein M3439_00870 [Chloroflexota bacterium]|nr:hypothetical protein [Chloroflexota bacterium]
MDNRMADTTDRRTIATYVTYPEAQRAVDYLADQRFPVERVAIVADGIKLVEQVTGRLSYGRAALSGALSGALTGAFFGFIFGLFDWIDPLVSGLVLALYGLIFGAIVGAIFGAVAYAMTGGKRDFTSISGMQADRYSVMVEAGMADEAAGLLSSFGGDHSMPPAGGRGATPAVG